MTKILTYTGTFKTHLLADELQTALAWEPLTAEGTARLESLPDGSEVYIYADDDTDEAAVDAVVAAHDPSALSVEEQKQVYRDDVNLRFAAANLAGKTPRQIYTAMQGKIDGWSSLAQAKADLREWLPLMAAGLVWLVKNGE